MHRRPWWLAMGTSWAHCEYIISAPYSLPALQYQFSFGCRVCRATCGAHIVVYHINMLKAMKCALHLPCAESCQGLHHWTRFSSRCIWDTKPRAFDSNSTAILANFAELVVRELEMHAVLQRQLSVAKMLKRAMDCYNQGYLFVDVAMPGWRIMHVNQAFSTCTGTLSGAKCSAHGVGL